MRNEALEILNRLYQETNTPYTEYSRLYDLVECLVGDFKTSEQIREHGLQKLDAITEIINKGGCEPECLVGDFKTSEQIREHGLQKLDAITEIINKGGCEPGRWKV